MNEPRFAELHCLSHYSFLRGASYPEELVATAAQLGYQALAITDECSLAGVVKAYQEAKRQSLKLLIGSEFRLPDAARPTASRPSRLILLAANRAGYARISGLITQARRAAPKGEYRLTREHLLEQPFDDCLAIWLPDGSPDASEADGLKPLFRGGLWLGLGLFRQPDDRQRLADYRQRGQQLGLPLVACNDVHMHVRERRALQDTLTAIRLNQPLSELGFARLPNGERHLRPLHELTRLYPPELLDASVNIAEQCQFSLDELRYEYPAELVPAGQTPIAWLRRLTEQGADKRWPGGVPAKVRPQIEHELALIEELGYESFFLTIHDLVEFARGRGILCQGRGSAANSAVCYCLGITEVDPARLDLLFERFISRERNEPPDIDVDFEHERREEVIQYIYAKYGRDRAALAASVITYRGRSAVRDVAKALGFAPDQVAILAAGAHPFLGGTASAAACERAGFDPADGRLKLLVELVEQLHGFPRHLSQHSGGFVIAADELSRLVPVENAAMPERTVIQWDKNDLESLGLLKVDVLALGMLTAIRKALCLISAWSGSELKLADVPAEDPAVYTMLQAADSIGVFQVESRAQMAMLPRLKPRCYYDLVIQIAIVRPGPIQGDMVHPYLARRSGKAPISYPGPGVEQVLGRTLGVPIFQEQVMQLAMVAAGFSAGEADQLRRAMAAWQRRGGLEPFEARLLEGMRQRGYTEEFATQITKQIRGFGEYGFPESHSASFALLAYVSAWLKCHHPAAFTCALLNSQPLGFYAPAQLIADAQRHDVEIRPIDVRFSDWDSTLEPCDGRSEPALRLGLRLVKGLSASGAADLLNARKLASEQSQASWLRKARLGRTDLEALAAADALAGISGHRHRAFWAVSATTPDAPLALESSEREAEPLLRPPSEGEDILADYAASGLSLRRHPLSLLRPKLEGRRLASSADIRSRRSGSAIATAGLVICRQRPMTAAGVVFLTLEDEWGISNVVVWPKLVEQHRLAILQSRLLAVRGRVQQEDDVLHVIAEKVEDLSDWLGDLKVPCRDFG